MQIRTSLVALLLLLMEAVHAEPSLPTDTYIYGQVSGCRSREDAVAVAAIAATDFVRSQELFAMKKVESGRGTYRGLFVVMEFVEQYGPIWVVRIITAMGELYIFYQEPERRTV